jgi:hypothetical protein
MEKSNLELSGLIQAGSKVQKSVLPSTDDKPIGLSDIATASYYLGEHVSTPDGEPSIKEKFRDAGVYGETGGPVPADSSRTRDDA